MARATGIGGVFIRSKNPEASQAWYKEMLGIEAEGGHTLFRWADDPRAESGATVWAQFAADTDYLKPSDWPVMVNFRVDDLDAVLAHMKARGVTPVGEPQSMDGVGRFAWVLDPDGIKIELWEPAAPAAG